MAGPVPPPLNFTDNGIASQGGCCTRYDADQVRFNHRENRYEAYNVQVSCCFFGSRDRTRHEKPQPHRANKAENRKKPHRKSTNEILNESLEYHYQVSLRQAALALDINLDEPLTWEDGQRIQTWAEAQKVNSASNSYFQDVDETTSGLQMRLDSGQLQPLQLKYIIERMEMENEERRKSEEKRRSGPPGLSDEEAQKVALAVVGLLVTRFALPNRGEGIVTPRNVEEAIKEVKSSARGTPQQDAMVIEGDE